MFIAGDRLSEGHTSGREARALMGKHVTLLCCKKRSAYVGVYVCVYSTTSSWCTQDGIKLNKLLLFYVTERDCLYVKYYNNNNIIWAEVVWEQTRCFPLYYFFVINAISLTIHSLRNGPIVSIRSLQNRGLRSSKVEVSRANVSKKQNKSHGAGSGKYGERSKSFELQFVKFNRLQNWKESTTTF